MSKHDSRETQLRENAERLLLQHGIVATDGIGWWAAQVVRLIDDRNALQSRTDAALRAHYDFLALVMQGGWMVSSARCSADEIVQARAENRMYVDPNGFGFIVRPAASFPQTPTELPGDERVKP